MDLQTEKACQTKIIIGVILSVISSVIIAYYTWINLPKIYIFLVASTVIIFELFENFWGTYFAGHSVCDSNSISIVFNIKKIKNKQEKNKINQIFIINWKNIIQQQFIPKGGSSLGPGGRQGRPHVPMRVDNNCLRTFTLSLRSSISDLGWVVSTLSQVIWASTCSCTIDWMVRDWELKLHCEELMVDTLQLACISSIIVF
jgi:hypothetical protein